MKTTKLISVIIPCHNVEDYLERCVDSVLGQTIGQDQMEIILVDDCSTDGTGKLIERYEREYECVKAIYNEKKIRPGGARNRGLDIARGKYIGFVDSDDWIEPQMYHDMCACAKKYDCDLVNILSVRDFHYGFIPYEPLEEESITLLTIEGDVQRAEMIASGRVKIGAWNCLFLRELIQENNIRFPDGVFYEDIFWGTIVHLYFRKVCMIDKTYYHYYVRNNSAVVSNDTKTHEEFFTMQTMLWDELKARKAVACLGEAVEFDYLMNYYILGTKLLSLRFTKFPYELFYRMQREIAERIPEWEKNRYLKSNTTDFQKMQFEILKHTVSHKELDQFSEITAKYYGG